MTLYFETPVVFPESGSISVNSVWHSNTPLLAVASFSQDRGGFVIIFDELVSIPSFAFFFWKEHYISMSDVDY